jgi:FixJ family two-component response regulator
VTVPSAIALAPKGATGSFRTLIDRLTGSGIQVAIVDDVLGAAEIARQFPVASPCILLDLRDYVAGSDIDDLKHATEMIRRTVKAMPTVMPVVVTSAADVAMVIACVRAGAGDVIDLQAEGTAAARAVVQRVFQRQLERAADTHTADQLRTMIEDLLKDLIRTERRSIDLEEKLAAARQSGELPALTADSRPPAILLVDADREISDRLADLLENAGVSTYAYVTGEDAVRDAEGMLANGIGFDLALVAAQLPPPVEGRGSTPGIDGLETVRRLRERSPGLPAFLMTAVQDAQLASDAADLGVVGFVHKPFAEIDDLVARLVQLSRESLLRTREHLYLRRIKTRHERVLARYRSLPREG